MDRLVRFFHLLVFLLTSSLSVGANADHPSGRVTFINPGFENNGFWKSVTDTMKEAADQLGFELELHYADRQWPLMVEKAEAVIRKPAETDFLILVNEHQQAGDLLDRADKAGIPTLMLLNSLTEEQLKHYGLPRQKLKNWLGSITPDNEIAGYEMAKSLAVGSHSGDGVAMLTLAGDNATPASIYRLNGLDRALKEYPTLSELRRISVNWSDAEAYERTLLWLETGQPLSAVWAANDPIALGAIRAIRAKGLRPGTDVLVSGLNWSPEAIGSVLRGEMTLTHGGHFLAGAWAMVILYDYVHGHDFASIDSQISFPMTPIDNSNAQRYLDLFGSSDWSKVEFQKFSLTDMRQKSNYDFSLAKLIENASTSSK